MQQFDKPFAAMATTRKMKQPTLGVTKSPANSNERDEFRLHVDFNFSSATLHGSTSYLISLSINNIK